MKEHDTDPELKGCALMIFAFLGGIALIILAMAFAK